MVAKSGNGWKLAASLITMYDQVQARWPKRKVDSDGTIGDLAHMARTSDHNIHNGYCHALDLTHDPNNGFSSEQFANMLLERQDPRLKYVISNRKIGSGPAGPSPGVWRAYNGANPHNHHCHISVNSSGERDGRPWVLDDVPHVQPDPLEPAPLPTLRLGSVGVLVKELQTKLGIKSDAIFGPATKAAVIARQKASHVVADGVVGPQTWKVINA